MKKIIAAIICVMLLLSMGVTAYATDSGEDFAKILTDGKLIFKSVVPETAEEFSGIFTVTFAERSIGYENLAEDFTSADITINYGQENEETRSVEIVYEYDREIAEQIDELSKNIPTEKTFGVYDLELINYWVYGRQLADANTDEEFMEYANDINNYSGEFQSIIEHKNIQLNIMNNAGENWELQSMRCGVATLVYDGVIYWVNNATSLVANHIVYVPDDTATDKDSLLAAAQKRINDYLGNETSVVLKYERATYDYEKEELGVDAEHYYSAVINGKDYEYGVLIVPDSSKMVEPEHKTADLKTKIEISTDSASVPLDAKIAAECVTSGEKYEQIAEKLDSSENVIYDIKLYSNSKQSYVQKIENGNFEVKIPVPAEFKNKELEVVYVSESGEAEAFETEVLDGSEWVKINTNHFSTYVLTAKEKTDNSKTDSSFGSVSSENTSSDGTSSKSSSVIDTSSEKTESAEKTIPPTGDSSTIAFAVFALAAVALAVTKKR